MYLYLIEYEALKDYREDHIKQRQLADRLLRYAVKEHYGLDADSLEIELGGWGKPYFKDREIFFSKSHTKGMVALGIGERELGVDCQFVRPVTRALMRRTCREKELETISDYRDFALVWAKKEALGKLSGRGIRGNIREIDSFSVPVSYLSDTHAAAAVSAEPEGVVLRVLSENDI